MTNIFFINMFELVSFLMVFVIIFLAAGLIKPGIVRLESRKQVAKYGAITFFGGLVLLVAATPSTETPKSEVKPVDSAATAETPKAEEPKPVEKAVTVKASELYTAYHDNEVAADAQYKGKLVEISGIVDGIDNGTFDNELIVRVNAGQMFNYVSCTMLPNEKDNVIALKKGQSVKVSGKVTGSTLGTPFIKDCAVVK